jgi:hypothetical protein
MPETSPKTRHLRDYSIPTYNLISHARDTTQADDYLKTQQPVLVVIENNFFKDTGIVYAAKLKEMRRCGYSGIFFLAWQSNGV